jgi:4-amino-4-deoxy-L-arabinose transferase-like glycosyltransferase
MVSLACFALSSWYVFLAASRMGNRASGAIAMLVFCLAPEVVTASAFFGTDAPLYLATAAMLYYLLKALTGEKEDNHDWIALGLAIGLGFLSKTSFLLIGPPALICWLWLGRRTKIASGMGLRLPLKAGTLALIVAGPWWLLHAKDAAGYAQYARGFVRDSLGPPSLVTWMKWMDTVIQALLGHGTSLFIALVGIAILAAIVRGNGFNLLRAQRSALWVCASAGIPIVLAQLAGTNHLLRHITPSVIPLAIAIGILAERTLWARTLAGAVFASLLLFAQLGMIVYPVVFPNTAPVEIGFVNGALPWRSLARFDQWDWKPLWELSTACNLQSPRISYLGDGREFDPPAIQYPWVMAAMPKRLSKIAVPGVTWLWRYEDGPLDWQKMISAAEQSDLVVTAPLYLGEAGSKEDEDNQHNSEFAQLLSQDARFQGPIHFQTGRFSPVEIDVFVKRGLDCQAVPTRSPKE